jgi:hypothetical protein
MIRRRPIPRFKLRPPVSQHYELILDGAVRRYTDGREVCEESAAGRREYLRRLEIMVQRQNFRCSGCKRRLSLFGATFDHNPRRKMGAAFRDDRVVLPDGSWINSAMHWSCNGEKG